ncbi:MAG TPA: cadmium-translocating P-type ATPase [Candidatus Acetothermia bacterium]|nr:cadmium-translocating P-type ATPase [Candidatus Acetothermia bacterium]
MAEQNEEQHLLHLKGLSCATCAVDIEQALHKSGYDSASVNFSTGQVILHGDLERAKQVIKRVEPEVGFIAAGEEEEEGDRQPLRYILPALVLFLAGLVFRYWYPIGGTALTLPLFVVAYVFVGWRVVRNAGMNLIHGKLFDENLLLVIATFGAFAIQEYPEAVGVMLFYVIGEFFQDLAVGRARSSVKSLLSLKVDSAHRVSNDGTIDIPLEEVNVEDVIVVRPGERVPLDGEVIGGSSTLDTSALTGESVPRRAGPGEGVLSGMLNLSGLLQVKVAKRVEESTLTRILELVESAGARKAKTERFITRFAKYYTPAVVGLAMMIGLIVPLVTRGSFIIWGYRALVLLVISCPCALVLSIPLGYFGGIGRASKQGVLIKGSNFLDALARVEIVAFDKTGTLTKGTFRVTDVVPADGRNKETLLQIAARAEAGSNHPIAVAIKSAYTGELNGITPTSHEEIAGEGVLVRIEGNKVLVGNDRMLHHFDIPHTTCDVPGTVAHVAIDGAYAGYLIIADEVKDDAARAIRELKRLGVRKVVLVTGDSAGVAAAVAERVGVDQWHAELLPGGKVEVIEALEREKATRAKVAFVGDGINDAPVIARADVGIAMGGLGSDAAIETADVVIMDDRPSKLALGILTARKTKRIVWQNIIFALVVKVGFIGLGIIGEATMWEAVFADVGVALIAVLNAMRILRT